MAGRDDLPGNRLLTAALAIFGAFVASLEFKLADVLTKYVGEAWSPYLQVAAIALIAALLFAVNQVVRSRAG